MSKTAKEMMEEGKWEHLGTYSYKKGAMHFYKGEMGEEYRVYKMSGASKRGVPFFLLMKYGCKVLRVLFNLAGGKLGEELFSELIEECSEYLKIRKHKERIGVSVTLQGRYKTKEECIDAMTKEVSKLEGRLKGRKKK